MAEKDKSDIIEEGDIFFLYRPDVEEESPEEIGDIQRFYMVLRPRGGNLRLLVIGQKHLPDIEQHERDWGFVDMVTDSAKRLEQELREETYETKTRGERTRPTARPAGEGVYAITLVDDEMHLVYSLELPYEPDEVQQAFNIAPEGSLVLSVKNPQRGQPANAGLREEDKADYPQELQKEFRDRRFANENPRLLDYEGAEIMLVGARTNPEEAYDIDLEPEDEGYEDAETIRTLRMVKSRHPMEPLFEGRWA